MHGEPLRPHDIDVTTPSVARMYDYLLGGKDNYQADRNACEQLLKTAPSTRELARNNRLFLQRVVRYLAVQHGIDQFIDHGSGFPARENVHQVAQRVHPGAAVVYVDHDPVVIAHSRALLGSNEHTAVLHADLRNTDLIFGHEDTRRLIDFSRPVAALFVSVLHCLRDEDQPAKLMQNVIKRLAPGSCLVICQLVSDQPQIREVVTSFMRRTTNNHWGRVREESEVQAYFTGLDIIEPPGLVEVSTWMPDTDLAPRQKTFEWKVWGGVGIVP
ncbi:SAM-dependent methyltransferase [Streptomyces coeruleoprunus]|uniref:SAM-dependent methyltransferase n=1 Tax=Streptomyces coeruleoprunus TaxID=285563 RepID=A0ABV9XPI1_9ACTN